MRLLWSEESWSEYLYWQDHDPAVIDKINLLIKDSKRSPFTGIGKPEPLKDSLRGWWARRITREHRFIYRVTGSGDAQTLEISACRFHY